jgi:hypothetical protein
VSTNYSATTNGTLTFTANEGYTGDESTGYIDTGFNPNSASGNFSLNSATLAVRNFTSISTTEQCFLGESDNTGGPKYSIILPDGGVVYFDLNGSKFFDLHV